MSIVHKLTMVGYLDRKRVYMDVEREDAIRRYCAAFGEAPQEVEEIEFRDEFEIRGVFGHCESSFC